MSCCDWVTCCRSNWIKSQPIPTLGAKATAQKTPLTNLSACCHFRTAQRDFWCVQKAWSHCSTSASALSLFICGCAERAARRLSLWSFPETRQSCAAGAACSGGEPGLKAQLLLHLSMLRSCPGTAEHEACLDFAERRRYDNIQRACSFSHQRNHLWCCSTVCQLIICPMMLALHT